MRKGVNTDVELYRKTTEISPSHISVHDSELLRSRGGKLRKSRRNKKSKKSRKGKKSRKNRRKSNRRR